MNKQRPRPAGKREAIGVMIVDDHEAVRSGLATFLEAFNGFRLVGQAGSGGEALRLCKELKPDVVLVDLGMSRPDGVETIRAIRQSYPEVQVIAMASYEDHHRSSEALCAGAADCLRKDTPLDKLAAAIRSAGQERRKRAGLQPPPDLSAP